MKASEIGYDNRCQGKWLKETLFIITWFINNFRWYRFTRYAVYSTYKTGHFKKVHFFESNGRITYSTFNRETALLNEALCKVWSAYERILLLRGILPICRRVLSTSWRHLCILFTITERWYMAHFPTGNAAMYRQVQTRRKGVSYATNMVYCTKVCAIFLGKYIKIRGRPFSAVFCVYIHIHTMYYIVNRHRRSRG